LASKPVSYICHKEGKVNLKRTLYKDSLVGRFYFWYWKNVVKKPWETPENEDTCGIRKALLLGLPAGFFIYRIADTFLRLWMIAALGLFIWASLEVPDLVAGILVWTCVFAVGILVLFFSALVFLVVVLFLFRGLTSLLDDLIGRLVDRLLRLLGILWAPVGRAISAAWEWFWSAELVVMGWPLYPWLVLFLGLQIASLIFILLGRAGGAPKWYFWIMSALELLVVGYVGWRLLLEWATEKHVGGVISAPIVAAGRSVKTSRPVQGSWGALKVLWASLKQRVCIPVEWV
jgi:hypothetical protein